MNRVNFNLALAVTFLVTACDTGTTTSEAEDQVRALLRDPASAVFTDEVRHPAVGDKGPVVCGRVNSRNGFGGMSGSQRFVSGGKAMVEDNSSPIGIEVFDGVWKGLCGDQP